jgi:hypothetical protein
MRFWRKLGCRQGPGDGEQGGLGGVSAVPSDAGSRRSGQKPWLNFQDPALPEWLRDGAEDAMWSWIFPRRHKDPGYRASSAAIMRDVEKVLKQVKESRHGR